MPSKFDEMLAAYKVGNRLQRSPLLPGAVNHPTHFTIDNFRQRIAPIVRSGRRQGEPTPLLIDYIEDDDFNAFATNYDGIDMIAVSYGVRKRLVTFFRAVMSHQSSFTNVGSTSSRKPVIDARIVDLSVPISRDMIPALLEDTKRQRFADDLAIMAELFILEHEWAHIRHGHVDWAASRGCLRMSERGMATDQVLTGLDLQTLEWDADSAAVMALFEYAGEAETVVRDGRNVLQLPSKNRFGSVEAAMVVVSTVAYACFRLFAEASNNYDVEHVLASDHPPAWVRIWLNLQLMPAVLNQVANVDATPYLRYFEEGIRGAERMWANVSGKPTISVTEELGELASTLHRLFEDRWSSIQPELEMYKRSGRLAPAENCLGEG